MRPALLSVPAILLALAAPARAQTVDPPAPPEPPPPPAHVAVRLSFKTVPGCPVERAFRAEVASWVGYDPFTPDGVDLITIWFERAGPGFASGFTLTTPAYTSGVHREVEASCTGLYRTMGIGVGLTIAPSDGPLPPAPVVVLAEAPKEAAPVAASAPVSTVVVPAAPPAKRNVGFHAGLDAAFNPVAAPSVSFGFAPSVGVRFREPSISIDLGLRAMWSVRATVVSNGDANRWTYASGVLAASIHKGFFFAGPLLEAGTLSPRPEHGSIVNPLAPGFFAVGLRVGVERPVADLFTLRTWIEGEYVPVGARLQDPAGTGRLLWAMPSFSTTIAAGLTFDLW